MLKERMWERLGGNSSVIQFQVSAANEVRFAGDSDRLEITYSFTWLILVLTISAVEAFISLRPSTRPYLDFTLDALRFRASEY